MRKSIVYLLMVFATLFAINIMVPSVVSAQDVWVYTVGEGPSKGREFYVQTETAQYVDADIYDRGVGHIKRYYLEIKCIIVIRNGDKYDHEYHFDYDEKAGKWICYEATSPEYSIDDKYYPELRYIFEAAKKYATRTVKRNF